MNQPSSLGDWTRLLIAFGLLIAFSPFFIVYGLYRAYLDYRHPGTITLEEATYESVEYRPTTFRTIMDNYDNRYRYQVTGHRPAHDNHLSVVIYRLVRQGYLKRTSTPKPDAKPDDIVQNNYFYQKVGSKRYLPPTKLSEYTLGLLT